MFNLFDGNVFEYHQEMVDTIKKKIDDDTREIFIETVTGISKITVIKRLVDKLDANDNILILIKEF